MAQPEFETRQPDSSVWLLSARQVKEYSQYSALRSWVSHLTSLGLKFLLCKMKVNDTIAKPLFSSNTLWHKLRSLKILETAKIKTLPLQLIVLLVYSLFYFILLLDMLVSKRLLNSYWVQTMVVSWEQRSNDCMWSGASWITVLMGHGILIHFFLNIFADSNKVRWINGLQNETRLIPHLYCIEHWNQ